MEGLEFRLACKENTEIGDWIVIEGTEVAKITEIDKNIITAGIGTTIHKWNIKDSIVLRRDRTYTFGGGTIKKGDFLIVNARGVSKIDDTDKPDYDNSTILHQTSNYSVGKNLIRR